MLARLVLGGITLAVTGYGIKKYCESQNEVYHPYQPETKSEEQKSFEEIDWLRDAIADKFYLFEELFSKLQNSPFMAQSFHEDNIPTTQGTIDAILVEHIKEDLLLFGELFEETIKRVEENTFKEADYTKLEEREQYIVDICYKLAKKLHETLAIDVFIKDTINPKYITLTKELYEIKLEILEYQKGDVQVWWM